MVSRRLNAPKRLENNLLEVSATKGLVELVNGLLDKEGHAYKRPGLFRNRLVGTNGVKIDGLYWWNAKSKLLTVSNGKIFATATPKVEDENISGTNFLNQGMVQFADTGYWLYMAAGNGKMLKWDGLTATVEKETDPVAPEHVSTVEAINTRIVCNQAGTNRMWYTKPASLTNPQSALEWEGYIEIDRTGEQIVGIKKIGSELYIFKERSVSAWYDDGVTPFHPIVGSERNIG